MKKLAGLLAIILSIGAIFTVQGKVIPNQEITVFGWVGDSSNGNPLKNHTVYITVDSMATPVLTDSVLTNNTGYYYFQATVQTGFQVFIEVRTYDCNRIPHQYYFPYHYPPYPSNFLLCAPTHHCDNYFTGTPDTNIAYSIAFQSVFDGGSPDTWLWDFGDGSYSVGHNPLHIYPAAGIYLVCLTMHDSILDCTAHFCSKVHVVSPLPVNCHADFNPQQDAGSLGMQFTDQSSGNVHVWDWDFGDGGHSGLRNPYHVYNQVGNYNVCLTVYDTFPNPNCWDQDNKNITVQAFNRYNLGGQIFAGLFPILEGNPVYLFKSTLQGCQPMDTSYTNVNGVFYFYHISEGDYYVHTFPLNDSATYDYFPTYGTDALFWQNASLIHLSQDYYHADIHLVTVPAPLNGPGSIAGSISYFFHNIYTPAVGTEILLLGNADNAITFKIADVNGSFSFTGLPYGTYKLYPEIAGEITHPVTIVLDAANPDHQGIFLVSSGNNVTSVNETGQSIIAADAGNIYPDPLDKTGNIRLIFNESRNSSFTITDQLGRVCMNWTQEINSGDQVIQFSAAILRPGFYFLVMDLGKDGRLMKKFIKQ